jgi:hypothetical protein
LQPMMYQEPPGAQSIRSLYHITRILCIIFGILLLLGGLAYVGLVVAAYLACSSVAGIFCPGLGYVLWFPILVVVWGVVDIFIYMQMRQLEGLVNNRQYQQAKDSTMLWMIVGFILGGIIIGVLLLIAWLKFDPLIAAQRNMQMGGAMPPPGAPFGVPPSGGSPPPMPGPVAPVAPPPPPPAAAPPAAPFCGNCGKPTTYIPQYGRYYCYDCKLYV